MTEKQKEVVGFLLTLYDGFNNLDRPLVDFSL